jgi:transcriptional regulator with XRE-family HTH domain
MELSKKIKQIRNENKLTQEQFAEKMLVSRTAVSKWENGTCYPSIDSLKYMSKTFKISLDKLLSNEEILEIAKIENQSNISKYNSLLFCLLDIIRIVFIFLPLYSYKTNDFIYSVSLFNSNDLNSTLKIIFMLIFIIFLALGIIELIFNYKGNNRFLNKISIFLDVISIFILLFTKQPYVIALMFVIFIIKTIMLVNVNKSVVKNNKCERWFI